MRGETASDVGGIMACVLAAVSLWRVQTMRGVLTGRAVAGGALALGVVSLLVQMPVTVLAGFGDCFDEGTAAAIVRVVIPGESQLPVTDAAATVTYSYNGGPEGLAWYRPAGAQGSRGAARPGGS